MVVEVAVLQVPAAALAAVGEAVAAQRLADRVRRRPAPELEEVDLAHVAQTAVRALAADRDESERIEVELREGRLAEREAAAAGELTQGRERRRPVVGSRAERVHG